MQRRDCAPTFGEPPVPHSTPAAEQAPLRKRTDGWDQAAGGPGFPEGHAVTAPDRRMMRILAVFTAAGCAGCAGCAGPPAVPPGGMLGYGTPGVSSYMPAAGAVDLQALTARCRGVPLETAPPPQTLAAACDQLRRTSRNQPGNTVAAPRP